MSEWMRDDAYSEVLVGRLFVILGVKFAEMAKSEWKFQARYLGANHNIDDFSPKQPDRARQIRVSMTNYLLALVARFQDDHPDAKLYPVTSPYLPEAQWADANDQPGVYQGSVCELRRERALCISGWQAGYLDCGVKVDHEGHSMDRS